MLPVATPLFRCIACGMSVETLAMRINGEKPNLSKFLCPRCNGHSRALRRQPKPFTHVCDKCGDGCYGVRCQNCRTTRCCKTCGSSFRSRNPRTYCSKECEYDGKGITSADARQCVECGDLFTPSGGKNLKRQRFCSVACRYAEARRKPPKPPRSRVYFPTCSACGVIFASRRAGVKYCPSVQCRIDRAGRRINDLYASATEFVDGQYRGAMWRKALLQYLVERDGDRCGICNRKVDITLKSGTRGSRRGPSVDHIIPRSLGGTDDPANLRLAHWGCNQKRGNRGGGEQLALVG